MNMKHLLLSGILLPALIAISFALNQGLIQAVVGDGDVTLTVDSGTLPNGQIIALTGVLDFAADNISYIHRVALVVDGPDSQDLDVALPLEEVAALDLTSASGVTGESLVVTVDFDDVVGSGGTLPGGTIPGGTIPGETLPGETLPDGTLPGGTLPIDGCSGGTLPGTLPGGTLPGDGNGFIGVGDGGTITYSIDWNPSMAGSYQGHLEVIASGVNGCVLISSDVVEFSVIAAPPPPDDSDGLHVTLCHVPRGNPAAAHVITVGMRAVAAHMRHGDYISTTCQPPNDTDLHSGSHDDSDDDDNHSDDDGEFAKKGKGKKSDHDAQAKFKGSKGQKPNFDDDTKPAKKGRGKPSHDADDEKPGKGVKAKPTDKGNKDKGHDDDKGKKSSEKSRGKPSHDANDKDDDKKQGKDAKAKPDKGNKDKGHDDDKGKKSSEKSRGKPSHDDDDKKPGKSKKGKGRR